MFQTSPNADAQIDIEALNSAELYVSVELTPAGEAATGLDGISCDREGNLFVANYSCPGAICQLTIGGETRDFASLPDGCPITGMQYRADGMLLVADPQYDRILQVDTRTREVREYARGLASLMMGTPENIAVAANGFAYVTDPDWETHTGRLWGIDADGASFPLEWNMGTANGIALSPDDRVLYVGESVQGFVALADRGNIEGFRVERPGLGWESLSLSGKAPTQVAPASWGQVKQQTR